MNVLRAVAAPIFFLSAAARAFAAPAAPVESPAERDAAAGRQWKVKLGLNAEQGGKFLAALKTKDADLAPRREELRGVTRRLQAQLSENAAEKDVQDALQKLARLRRVIALRNEQFDAETASFLSPSERARLLVWRSLNACRGKTAENLDGDDLQEATSSEEVEPE